MSVTSTTPAAQRIAALIVPLIWLSSCSSTATKQPSTVVGTSVLATTPAIAVPVTAAPVATESASTEPATIQPATTQPATTVSVPATVASGPLQGLPAGVPGAFPDGTYVVDVTDADLAAVNVHADEYNENHGRFTWTMTGGTWTFVQTAENVILNPSDSGTYVVQDHDITFYVTSDLGPQEFTWTANSDGTIQFAALPSTGKYFTAYVASHPWTAQS